MTVERPEVPGKYIVRMITGSHAYGMATPESDIDIRGIFVPTKEYFLGFMKRVEQVEAKGEGNIDGTTIFDIRKFMNVASGCSPNVIELLFTPEDCILERTPIYDLLVQNRKLFLSKKAHWTFAGYAIAQIHRIEVHRKWLLNPPKAAPKREDYGLPPQEKLISKEQLGAFYVTLAHVLRDTVGIMPEMNDLYKAVITIITSEAFPGWEGLIQSRGIPDLAFPFVQKLTGCSENFIAALKREQAYYRLANEWSKYQEWLKTRNPKRAELEKKFGFDTKHGSHVVRLMEQGCHLMKTGELKIRLDNAEQIRKIRSGIWLDGTDISYDKIKEYAVQKENEMKELYDNCSVLPKEPDRKKLDELCISIVEKSIRGEEDE